MKDKVVLITGSSRGMGAAAARIAHAAGAKVVVHGQTDSQQLQDIAEELGAFKIACDVADADAVAAEVARVVDEHGSIDALITSAGYAKGKKFEDLEEADWLRDYRINVMGTVNFCQTVIPAMKQGGSIVTVSSIRGLAEHSRPGALPYCTSKAAVISLSVGLAKAYAPNIRVNCVAPGPTQTDMAASWPDELRDKYASGSLLGKIADPEDMAKVMWFFASEESGILTGQVITADAGYTLPDR